MVVRVQTTLASHRYSVIPMMMMTMLPLTLLLLLSATKDVWSLDDTLLAIRSVARGMNKVNDDMENIMVRAKERNDILASMLQVRTLYVLRKTFILCAIRVTQRETLWFCIVKNVFLWLNVKPFPLFMMIPWIKPHFWVVGPGPTFAHFSFLKCVCLG